MKKYLVNDRLVKGKCFLVNLILVVLFFSASAQKSNFSGTWVVNKQKINFNDAPDWILPTKFVVDQEQGRLILARTIPDDQSRESESKADLLFGGQINESVTSTGLTVKASMTWNKDSSSFTFSSHVIDSTGKPIAKISENWFLLNNGQTLMIDRFVEQDDGYSYNIKGFYEKQQGAKANNP